MTLNLFFLYSFSLSCRLVNFSYLFSNALFSLKLLNLSSEYLLYFLFLEALFDFFCYSIIVVPIFQWTCSFLVFNTFISWTILNIFLKICSYTQYKNCYSSTIKVNSSRRTLFPLVRYLRTLPVQHYMKPNVCLQAFRPCKYKECRLQTQGWICLYWILQENNLVFFFLFFYLVPKVQERQLSFFFFLKILFIFREREREGERKGEKHQGVVASHAPPTGDFGWQPRPVPWIGIQLAILWFPSQQHSVHWATSARAREAIFLQPVSRRTWSWDGQVYFFVYPYTQG